jgi:hypothetical protein
MEASVIRIGGRAARRAVILIAVATCAVGLIGASDAKAATFKPCPAPPKVADDMGVGYVVVGYYTVENLRATANVTCRKAKRVSRSVASRSVDGRCVGGTGYCLFGQFVCRHANNVRNTDRWVCKKGATRRIRFRITYREAEPPPDLEE